MFSFKQQPHQLFLLAAILFFVAALFSLRQSVDFHLYDTYIVAQMSCVFLLATLLLVLFWLLYVCFRRMLFSKILTWMHITITIVCLLFVLVSLLTYADTNAGLAGAPRRYYDYDAFNRFTVFDNTTKRIAVALIILLSGQLIFFVNFIAGLGKMVFGKRK